MVFIVGPARSGTSILYRALQHHTRFRPKNDDFGVDLTESKAFSEPGTVFQASPIQGTGAFSYMLFNERYYRAFCRATGLIRLRHRQLRCPDIPWKSLIGDISRERRVKSWRDHFNHLLLRHFFGYAKVARGAPRLLEKTPEHLYCIPEIQATFPSAQILCTYRHPIDVFTSYRRRLQEEKKALGENAPELDWLKLSTDAFVRRYHWEIMIAEEERRRNPARVMLVSYEDLVDAPRAVLERILTFLGEQYEEGMRIADETDQVSWKIDRHLFGEIKKKTKDWRCFITPEETRLIQDQLAATMALLGYARYG